MNRTVLSIVAVALSLSGSLEAAEPFYERRLEAGLSAYEGGEYQAAAGDLRIACFGLFAEPERLAACWTHLALAEAGGGDREAFAATVERILALEDRLQAYSQAQLTQEIRRLFEEQLRSWMPERDLGTVPSGPSPSPDAEEPPAESMPAIEEAPAAEEPPTEAPDEIDSQLENVRTLLATSRDRAVLEQAFESLSVAANQHPEHRELQLTVAEIGYRLRRWQDAVTYFQRGGVSESERPERLFYYAVALDESGDRGAAARVLEGCLPRLQKTEYVRGVAERILGPPVE